MTVQIVKYLLAVVTVIPEAFSNPTPLLSFKDSRRTIPTGSILNTASQIVLSVALHKQGVEWENITSATNANWQFENDTTIRSTYSATCLEDDGAGIALMATCNGSVYQLWDWNSQGNLINRGSKNCLTAGLGKPVGIVACEGGNEEQVFELPSGVEVVSP